MRLIFVSYFYTTNCFFTNPSHKDCTYFFGLPFYNLNQVCPETITQRFYYLGRNWPFCQTIKIFQVGNEIAAVYIDEFFYILHPCLFYRNRTWP